MRQFSWILPDLISVLSEIEASTGTGSAGADGGAGGSSGAAGSGGASAASASALQATSKQLMAFKQRLLQLSASVQALPGIDLSEQQQIELHAKLTQKLQKKLYAISHSCSVMIPCCHFWPLGSIPYLTRFLYARRISGISWKIIANLPCCNWLTSLLFPTPIKPSLRANERKQPTSLRAHARARSPLSFD